MTELLVFEPALCCSTGICGPEVDPELVRFAADIEAVRAEGAHIQRYNLAQEAKAFAHHTPVRDAIRQEGIQCLPLILVGGRIASRGRYPSRAELLAWTGLEQNRGERTAAGSAMLPQAASPRSQPSAEPDTSAGPGCAPGSGCC